MNIEMDINQPLKSTGHHANILLVGFLPSSKHTKRSLDSCQFLTNEHLGLARCLLLTDQIHMVPERIIFTEM